VTVSTHSVESSEETRPTEERAVEKMPQTTDIVSFVEALRSVPEYCQELKIRKSKLEAGRLKLDQTELEPLTDEDVERSWEGRDEFKDYFFDFASRVLHLKYSPPTAEIKNLFGEYIIKAENSVRINNAGEFDTYQKRDAELARNKAHTNVAMGIYKHLFDQGFYHDYREDERRGEILGRAIARAWLVDVGADFWASARTMDVVRRANAVDPELSSQVLNSQKYKPGSLRWFEKPSEVAKAREVIEGLLTENLPDLEIIKFFQKKDAPGYPIDYNAPIPPDINFEHDTNPLTKKPFS